MDNGALFDSDFRVRTAQEGGFILHSDCVSDRGRVPDWWAFSNISDLMEFLTEHSHAFANRKQDGGSVTHTGPGPMPMTATG